MAQAAKDYQLALRLSSREEWDTDAENEADGATKNPYAAWEWGTSLRSIGDLDSAWKVHRLASEAFDDIGDKARSIISQMDEGIDLAALGKTADAKDTITGAIKRMKKEGVALSIQSVMSLEAFDPKNVAKISFFSADQKRS